eukprot:scaffold770_cov255-Pinguiococcus_pyrenoidosus.AAC.7
MPLGNKQSRIFQARVSADLSVEPSVSGSILCQYLAARTFLQRTVAPRNQCAAFPPKSTRPPIWGERQHGDQTPSTPVRKRDGLAHAGHLCGGAAVRRVPGALPATEAKDLALGPIRRGGHLPPGLRGQLAGLFAQAAQEPGPGPLLDSAVHAGHCGRCAHLDPPGRPAELSEAGAPEWHRAQLPGVADQHPLLGEHPAAARASTPVRAQDLPRGAVAQGPPELPAAHAGALLQDVEAPAGEQGRGGGAERDPADAAGAHDGDPLRHRRRAGGDGRHREGLRHGAGRSVQPPELAEVPRRPGGAEEAQLHVPKDLHEHPRAAPEHRRPKCRERQVLPQRPGAHRGCAPGQRQGRRPGGAQSGDEAGAIPHGGGP